MSEGKRLDIELLRLVSAFGIVWFHSRAPGNEISFSALIVFVVLSAYLAGEPEASGGGRRIRAGVWTEFGTKFRARFRRLMIPWAVWFVIYGAINLVRGQPLLASDNGIIAGILAGTSIHLWYLPFIVGCLPLLEAIKRPLPRIALAAGSALLAAGILLLTPFWHPWVLALGYPWLQYALASAGVFVGTFFAYFYVLPGWQSLLLLGLILLASLQAIPVFGVGLPYLVGVFLSLPLVSKRHPLIAPAWVTRLSACTLGIYLSHMVFLGVLKRLLPTAGVLLPVIAFAAAALFVLYGRRTFPRLANYWS